MELILVLEDWMGGRMNEGSKPEITVEAREERRGWHLRLGTWAA
jgi:hypothetical protein